MKKRTIEIFTSGCPLCDDAVKVVRDLACPSCEIVIYNLADGCDTHQCLDKARAYGVTSVPAVVVDGTLADCCRGSAVDPERLRALGVGSPA